MKDPVELFNKHAHLEYGDSKFMDKLDFVRAINELMASLTGRVSEEKEGNTNENNSSGSNT